MSVPVSPTQPSDPHPEADALSLEALALMLQKDGLRLDGAVLDTPALGAWLDGLATVPVRSAAGGDVALLATILSRLDEGSHTALAAALGHEIAVRRRPAPSLAPPDTAEQARRLQALRAECNALGLDGFLVPRADRFQGEQVPPGDDRLAWLTGFTGSAGLAVVLGKQAAVQVDGRYTLQLRQQCDGELFDFPEYGPGHLCDWLAGKLHRGGVIGYDPWLHSAAAIKRLGRLLDARGLVLSPVGHNPIDGVWCDRPAAPLGPVVAHPVEYAGEASADKIDRLARQLSEQSCHAHLICQPDALAWLLNIRGCDVPNTPLPLAFAVLLAEGRVALFIDARKPVAGLFEPLESRVEIHDETALLDWLTDQVTVAREVGHRISYDPAATPEVLVSLLRQQDAAVLKQTDPVERAKAIKHPVEQAGIRAAHVADGVAMVRFLHWLEGAAPRGEVTEAGAVRQLRSWRQLQPGYVDDSFEAIAGFDAHGAIVHYRVTEASDQPLTPGGLLLLDSGGQYLSGTTDITRTVAIGEPSAEMCLHYTLVLRAHLAVSMARFPKGTTGAALDALARQPLWARGLDYDHGTGHGVGCYLNVHEGPQRLSKASHDTSLEPGMLLSNEPGYYREGEYGIRIENLVLVQPEPYPGDEREMLGFETLTLVPYDRRLIIAEMLTPEEQSWIDAYHGRVLSVLSPYLEPDLREWLADAVQPV